MKKFLIPVFVMVLFSVFAIPVSAQGPTGAGVTPTKANPSPYPTLTPTPKPVASPTTTSASAGTNPVKSDAEKALEIVQSLTSGKSGLEQVMVIWSVINNGKVADIDLSKVLNDWAVGTLTGLRDVVIGWMFPDFTADTPFNKVRDAFSTVLFGFLSILVVWRGIKILVDIQKQRLNFVLELSFFLGVCVFALYLLGLPILLKALTDFFKNVMWALAQNAGQTLNPGKDPFTILVDNVLSLFNQTTSVTPDKLILMILLPNLVFFLTIFLMGAFLWFLFLATFGQGGIALSLVSGSRALTGSFRIIASTVVAALQIFTLASGVLMLVLFATSPNMKQMSLWVFTLGIPVVLVTVFAVNGFITFVLARPIEKRLAKLEDAIAARSLEALDADSLAISPVDELPAEWKSEDEA